MRLVPSVRAAVPLALALLGLALTGTMLVHDVITTRTGVERTSRVRARTIGELSVAILVHELAEEHKPDVSHLIERFGTAPDLAHASVIDDSGIVRISTTRALLGARLEVSPSIPWERLIAEADRTRSEQGELSADGATMYAAFPFEAPRPDNALSLRRWMLVIALDMRGERAAAAAATRQLAWAMVGVAAIACLLAWILLRYSFVRRFDALVRRVSAYSAGAGRLEVPEEGPREVRQIARALNQLFTDLTSERTALRESEVRFRRVFESAPAIMTVSELESGRFIEVNETLVRVSGFTREELIGRSGAELGWMSVEDRQLIVSQLDAHGRVDDMEITFHTKSGAEIPCRYYAEILTIDGVKQLLAISQDIRRRRAMEDAMRASEARFRAVVEGSHEGIAFADPAGNIVYRSPSYSSINGYSDEERIGYSGFETIHPDDAARTRLAWQYLMATPGASIELAFRIRHKDGSWRHIETTAHNLLHDRNVGVVVLSSRDETKRRRAEEEQHKLQGMLIQAQRLEAIGTLAGGVAHDFNNILTAILMHLDFLKQEAGLTDAVRDGLRDLNNETRRAMTLTRQLLLFSRRKVMEPTSVELVALVDNLLKMLRRLIGEHLAMEFHHDVPAIWLDGDGGMLEQVVTNLVVNARDAIPDGGRITLHLSVTSLSAADSAEHPLSRPGRFALLQVADSGLGIAPEVRPHIFEPFFTTKEVGHGTGLGLATVHGIVQQHDGWIELESEPGHGSTFRIYLPLGASLDDPSDNASAGAPAQDSAEHSATPHDRDAGQRVLLVEDDDAIRRLMAQFLERAGFVVTSAESGAAALERWRKERYAFDVLVSDIVMPGGVDGLALAHILLSDNPALKVVLMTGYSRDLATSDLLTRQGVYLLSKPLDTRQLIDTIRQALER